MTVTVSLYSWVIGSAHHLTEMNIWLKFNENQRYGADTKFQGKSNDL